MTREADGRQRSPGDAMAYSPVAAWIFIHSRESVGFRFVSLRQLHRIKYSLPARQGGKIPINTGLRIQSSALGHLGGDPKFALSGGLSPKLWTSPF